MRQWCQKVAAELKFLTINTLAVDKAAIQHSARKTISSLQLECTQALPIMWKFRSTPTPYQQAQGTAMRLNKGVEIQKV